jgi:hypothetical protein
VIPPLLKSPSFITTGEGMLNRSANAGHAGAERSYAQRRNVDIFSGKYT